MASRARDVDREAMYARLRELARRCAAPGPRRVPERTTDDPDARVKCERDPGHDGLHVHDTGYVLYLWSDDGGRRIMLSKDAPRR